MNTQSYTSCGMVKARQDWPMVIATQVNGTIIPNRVKVDIDGPTVACTKASTSTTRRKVKVSKFGTMAEYTSVRIMTVRLRGGAQ